MPSPDERSPLLSSERDGEQPTESSPLLADRTDQAHGAAPATEPSKPSKKALRWPSIIAIVVLGGFVVTVMVLGFLLPPAIQTYAENAVILEPTNLALDSITATGVRARVQGNFRIDGSRVSDDNARRLGRFTAFVLRRLESKETEINIRLPSYDNGLLGSAILPPLQVDVLDGHNTQLDFVADIKTGDAKLMRKIVNDWLFGKLKELEVSGAAAVQLSRGFLPLGTHDLADSMVLEAKDVPSVPDYDIKQLNVHDVPLDDSGKMGVAANISVALYNDYPVALTVPVIGFEVLVPDCDESEPYIKFASAMTRPIEVKAKADIIAEAEGLIREIPNSLTKICPESELSPLDLFVQQYLDGEDVKVYVRGKNSKGSDLPDWAGSIIESITFPVDLPGRSFDNLIRNLSLTDVDFKLPSPFADPSDPDSQPRVSGKIEVLAAIPDELNVDIGVDSLRAKGDVFYHGEKFGELIIDHWQKASSKKIPGPDGDEDLLSIISKATDVPLQITNSNVFADILQKLLFGGEDFELDVKSKVDVKVATVLGNLVVKGFPAEGKIPVKHLPGDTLSELKPRVSDLRILNTSDTGAYFQASVNISNPSPYSAYVPYISIHLIERGYVVGEAIAKNLDLRPGANPDISVTATWDPAYYGGAAGRAAGQELLSDYLSGKNTTITLRTHRDSFPTMPEVGEALARIELMVPTPRIDLPGDDDNGEDTKHNFIREAIFHMFSSTASFTLASPMQHNTVHIEYINATAFYNHTEPIGRIIHDEPFDAPPGLSHSPHLPVEWSADHIGYDKLRDAIGGSLKLDAVANVTFRIGNWVEDVQYTGEGIGARISI